MQQPGRRCNAPKPTRPKRSQKPYFNKRKGEDMIIKKMSDVAAKSVQMEGAKNVSVRVIFGPDDKAPTFAMRVFEVDGGGHTPYHSHPFEHEVMILSGDVAVVTDKGPRPLNAGDMILVMPNEQHQFKNLSETEKASFMCIVPIAYQK
jgi:quercetin dioxygenase-like cupin family protein